MLSALNAGAASSSARAARGNRLAREAGGDVNNRLVGDGARETGIEDGSGAGVNDGVQTNFVSVLLTKRGDAGAAVGEGERDGADAGKPLDDGGVVSGEPPRRGRRRLAVATRRCQEARSC